MLCELTLNKMKKKKKKYYNKMNGILELLRFDYVSISCRC